MIVTTPLYSLKAWKTLGEAAVSQMYGIEGSNVFRRLGMRTQLAAPGIPTNPQTEDQQSWRGDFASAVSEWQALSPGDKEAWNYYQDNRRRRPVMSGYNLFISKYLLSNGNPRIPPGQ